ncbi:hypothetical protein FRB94_012730 [Tulasnella sp. JGI-2019a]|nr:hypothetical protein FRB94_012730 [Tulasnella sp. JGI-2019a]KAG9018442.1 hypothetical protein FRB93_000145 [Tulasnella sp. JGI-2019a]KAG9031830.1 hypothetical protein FRB95_002275 [Tulasnella sp. JGI-2019a]
MSANRRAADQSTTRRTTRHQNSSPYPKKKPAASDPTKQSTGLKATSTIASLFSFLNPFRSREETPAPPVPREQPAVEDDSFENDYRQDEDEAEAGNDTQYVDAVSTFSVKNSPYGRQSNQITFPLTSSPQRRTNFGSGPSPPHNMPPPPRDRRALPLHQQPAQHNNSLLNNTSPLVANATIQDMLGDRVKAGAGLTSEEVQQLFRVASAAPREAPLPTAAYLGRDFVPHPSRSYLAPPPPLQNTSSSTSQPFTFTQGGSSGTSSSSKPKPPRRRVYVGPGQSLNSTTRTPRTGMGLRATSSLHSGPEGPSTGFSRSSAVNDITTGGAQEGKRRRVEGMIGPQSGLGLSSSQSMFGVNSTTSAEPQQPQGPRFTFSSDDLVQKHVNGSSDEGKEKEGPRHFSTESSNNDNAVATMRRTSLAGINTGGFLRPTVNPTPSPAVPSPLRNVTKPAGSPSPPRRSRTSATVLDIIKDVDHELKTSASSYNTDVDDFVNPYESQGPKPPPILRSKKKSAPKKAISPPPEPVKKPSLPSSVQAIADSLPSKKSSMPAHAQDLSTKESSEQNHRKDRNTAFPSSKLSTTTAKPLSKQFPQQQSKSSPFLPPAKTNGGPKHKSPGKYTIYDVDEDDNDGMDIQELPSPPKQIPSSKPNGFSKSSSRSSPPPPIIVSEMDVEEEPEPFAAGAAGNMVTQKPSLVIEPGEPSRRLGRSPSLGPPANLYSPTIPSPLRLVSMPEQNEQEQEEDAIVAELDEHQGDAEMESEDVKQGQVQTSVVDVNIPEDKRMEKEDPKAEARNAVATSLPVFTFDAITTTRVAKLGPSAEEARKVSVDKLPKFAFSLTATATVTAFKMFAAKPANTGEWTCNTCMLKNPESAKTKCTICDATRPAGTTSSIPPASTTASFNWAASGFTPKAAEGTWTCSICMCSNPASATTKCTVCEAPAPNVGKASETVSAPPALPPAPPITAFNWSAAGFAAKAPAPGAWTCSTCQLSNPADVSKCTICGEVKM